MYSRSHYSKDPKWINAKFNSICSCGKKIKKYDSIYYYPANKTAVCGDCGQQGERDFEAARQDEDFYNSQY